jgi:hypothetical protein
MGFYDVILFSGWTFVICSFDYCIYFVKKPLCENHSCWNKTRFSSFCDYCVSWSSLRDERNKSNKTNESLNNHVFFHHFVMTWCFIPFVFWLFVSSSHSDYSVVLSLCNNHITPSFITFTPFITK